MLSRREDDDRREVLATRRACRQMRSPPNHVVTASCEGVGPDLIRRMSVPRKEDRQVGLSRSIFIADEHPTWALDSLNGDTCDMQY